MTHYLLYFLCASRGNLLLCLMNVIHLAPLKPPYWYSISRCNERRKKPVHTSRVSTLPSVRCHWHQRGCNYLIAASDFWGLFECAVEVVALLKWSCNKARDLPCYLHIFARSQKLQTLSLWQGFYEFVYVYRIVPNERSLCGDRHPDGPRKSRGTMQMFFSHFCHFFTNFQMFWGPFHPNMVVGLLEWPARRIYLSRHV